MPSNKPSSDALAQFRQAIDGLDSQIAQLIGGRLVTAAKLAVSKTDAPHFRPGREADVLRRLANETDLAPAIIEGIWRQIMTASLTQQMPLRVVVAGELLATARWRFGSLATLTTAQTPSHALKNLADNGADIAILPHWQNEAVWRDEVLAYFGRAAAVKQVWLVAQIPFFAHETDNASDAIPLTPAAVFGRHPPDASANDVTIILQDGGLHFKDGYHPEADRVLGVFQKP